MKKFAPLLVLLGGLLLLLGNKLPEFNFGNPFSGVTTESIEGSTLYLIHEKRNPTIDQVLSVRRAPAFVTENKLAGYVDMDEEEPTLSGFLAELLEKQKLSPPLLVLQKGESKVLRVRKWEKGLEDILK